MALGLPLLPSLLGIPSSLSGHLENTLTASPLPFLVAGTQRELHFIGGETEANRLCWNAPGGGVLHGLWEPEPASPGALHGSPEHRGCCLPCGGEWRGQKEAPISSDAAPSQSRVLRAWDGGPPDRGGEAGEAA